MKGLESKRSEGLGSGSGSWVGGIKGGWGRGLGLGKLGSGEFGVGGDLGSKESESRGLITFPTSLTPTPTSLAQLPRFQLP